MQISIDSSDLKRMGRDLRSVGKNVAFAQVVAATRTAVEAKAALQEEMRSVFDRPTPFTLNAIYVKSATKSDPEARVGIKDGSSVASAAVPPNKFLAAEIDSGERRNKSFEKRLQAAGAMPRGMFAVPGQGAQLDDAGNPRRSQVVQILSQVRGAGNIFPTKNDRRALANLRRNVSRAGGQYFALPNGLGKLPPGIYFARGSAFGHVAPIAVFVFKPHVSYRKRLDFDGVAQRTADVFYAAKLDEAIAQYAQ